MTTLNLMLHEMRFRWLNFALSLLAVVAAATLFVGGPTLIAGYSEETNKLVQQKQQELETQLDAQKQKQAGELSAKETELSEKLTGVIDQQNRNLAAWQKETNDTLAAMDKQTKRLMRDLGFNVTIIHKDTDMGDFYSEFKAVDMPEEYVKRLGESTEITKIRHIVATLQQKYKWNGRSVLLVGILPSQTQAHLDQKPPMGYRIPEGSVYLGHELGIDRAEGDKVTIGDKEFTIGKILPESGSQEDIMLAMRLHDAQMVLDKKGKINHILALGCQCKLDRLSEIREQLEKVLTDTRVTEHRSKAIARAEQRKLVEDNRADLLKQMKEESAALVADTKKDHADTLARQRETHGQINQQTKKDHAAILAELEQSRHAVEASLVSMFNVTAPLVVLICALWIGLLAWTNVRERRPEIGLLRALGKRSGSIAALFLGKAILLGLLGAAIGCTIAYLLAANLGPAALQTATTWLIATLLGAPLLAAMATYIPALAAIQQDPAIVLRDQ